MNQINTTGAVPKSSYLGYIRADQNARSFDGRLPGQEFFKVDAKDNGKIPRAEERRVEPARRDDAGKTNWSLMPFEAVEEINKVLDFGAKKYAEWNWTNDGGMKHSRVINSCLRHLFAYLRGEDKDPESGLTHLSHAGCNILFLIYYTKYPERFNKDDRHSKAIQALTR